MQFTASPAAPSLRAAPGPRLGAFDAEAPREAASPCLHCGSPVPAGETGSFCCTGCASVHALLAASGLERYYDLGGGKGAPARDAASAGSDSKWLEPFEARLAQSRGLERVELDVQGVHCTACVWLMEELFRRSQTSGRIVVNPALGRLTLTVPASFPLRSFVSQIERFGYRFGPARKKETAPSQALLTRLGLCVALSMNAMIFSVAIYAGLDGGPTYDLFQAIVFGLSVGTLVIGGSVFFRSAWQSLKRGVLHLDVPIALGLALAFTGSAVSFFLRRNEANYFDTLNVFVTLMLLGRYLQERVVEKNRRLLLDTDGAGDLLTRRIDESGAATLVRCGEIRTGDQLVVAPGDLVPVDAVLEGETGDFSLDWINGEAEPRSFAAGSIVPAGAFAGGQRAKLVRAVTDFAGSPLVDLLRAPLPSGADMAKATPFYQTLTRTYVAAVLTVATLGFAGWLLATHSAGRAADVATAVLVVTCPCAFGIATPLAYELAQAGLRRAGLYVRSPSFLDRALGVRRVAFDKTGTLTTGNLRASVVGEPTMTASDERLLASLVAQSTHPKSLAVATLLAPKGLSFHRDGTVNEIAGAGLEAERDGAVYRLGRPNWAASTSELVAHAMTSGSAAADLLFTKDGRVLAAFATTEELRADAREEVARLEREGLEVFILSGDSPERVQNLAKTVGVAADHAFGGLRPEEKATWVRERDRNDILMVGDGINDGLVVDAAHCSGTPAIDRPFVAARADFYFITPGLKPIRQALRTAERLAKVVRRNLVIAIVYNVVAVSLALTGRMSPLVCAVFMPVSSLSVLLATTTSFSSRRAPWKS